MVTHKLYRYLLFLNIFIITFLFGVLSEVRKQSLEDKFLETVQGGTNKVTVEILPFNPREDESLGLPLKPITIKFSNNNAKPIKLLRDLDGSDIDIHMPYYRLIIYDNQRKPLKRLTRDCGNTGLWDNLKWPEDYIIEIGPGKTYHHQIWINQDIPQDNIYSVTFEYIFYQIYASKERWEYPPNLWEGVLRSEEIRMFISKTQVH